MSKPKKFYGRWTHADINFIKSNYTSMSNDEMAKKLGRTKNSILNQRRKMGVGTWDYGKHDNSKTERQRIVNLGLFKITY
jgi:hypothetical protein